MKSIIKDKKLAKSISLIIDPKHLVAPVVLVAASVGTQNWGETIIWTLITLGISILPLLILITIQTKRGVFIDQEVPGQSQRNQVYWFGNLSLFLCILLLLYFSAPWTLITLLVAMNITGVIGSLFNLRWKVSVHTGATTGAVISLFALIGNWAVPTLILIPMIGWARVSLGRHTLLEVIVGACIGGTITALVFGIMMPN